MCDVLLFFQTIEHFADLINALEALCEHSGDELNVKTCSFFVILPANSFGTGT